MNSMFWTNTVWYILLGFTTLLELIYLFIKSKSFKISLAFFLTLLGLTLVLERIALLYLNSYFYYPKIFRDDLVQDCIVGNYFSQFSVSATMAIVAILNLKYHWYFIFAGIYSLIEELFLHLGIFRHNWYKTWMTLVSFPVLFFIGKKLFEKITYSVKAVYYYGYVILGAFALYTITTLWIMQLLGYMEFSTKLLSDPIKSRYTLAIVLFFIPPAFIIMLVYFSRLKLTWKALLVAALYTFYYICYKLKLVWIKEDWFLLITSITILTLYLLILFLDKLYNELRKQQ